MCWNTKLGVSREIGDLSALGRRIQQEEGNEEIVFNKKDVLAYLSQLIDKYKEIQDFRLFIEDCERERAGIPWNQSDWLRVIGTIEKAKQQYGLEGDNNEILKKLHKLMDKFPPPHREFNQGMGERIDLLDRLYKAGAHSAYKKVN